MDLNTVDWAASGRTDTFSATLVDPFSLREDGAVDFVPRESDVTWASDTDVLVQATISLVGDVRGSQRDRMVRLKHRVEVGVVSVDETLGTFFVEDPGRECLDGRAKGKLNCYSALWRMSADVLADDCMETAGSSAVAACRRLVEYAGGELATDLGVDPQATLISDEFHQIGENRLEVLRTVAGSMGWRVGVDVDGRITLSQYAAPKDRPIRYVFEDGRNCIRLSGFTTLTTRSEAVNRVVAWWSREELPDPDDGTGAWGLSDRYVVDLTEDRPFSFLRTGRRRTHAMQLSEPCSHSALVERAEQFLEENAGDAVDVTIKHAQVPGLGIGDVVVLKDSHDSPDPVAWRCEVIRTSASLTPGMVCETRLRIIGEA